MLSAACSKDSISILTTKNKNFKLQGNLQFF